MTQRELAENVGTPKRHISEMVTGKRIIIDEMAQRLAKALWVDYRALL
jgi:plasmid maintenance system antidote protein VapI